MKTCKTNTKEIVSDLLFILHYMKYHQTTTAIPVPYEGICTNITQMFWRMKKSIMNSSIDEIFNHFNNNRVFIYLKWDHYSGDINYPVPSTHPTLSPRQQFLQTENLWDMNTEYGNLRHNLLLHMINYFEEQLDNL